MTKIMWVVLLLISTGQVASAQANFTGNIIIDPYYGGPNWEKLLTNAVTADNARFSNINGIGPAGIRAEYMISNKIGVGLDFIYNNLSATFSVDSLNVDETIYKTYSGDMLLHRMRLLARFNFHFQVNNPALDAYFGVGAGFNARFVKVTSDDPEFDDKSIRGGGTLIPVAFRICTGMRYYFTENFGINGEIGLGGPTVSAGLSLRF